MSGVLRGLALEGGIHFVFLGNTKGGRTKPKNSKRWRGLTPRPHAKKKKDGCGWREKHSTGEAGEGGKILGAWRRLEMQKCEA